MTALGVLAPIIERKRAEAAAIHCGRAAMFAHAANLEHAPAIERVLAGGSVLAEIKRRSPSGGVLRADLDPADLGSAYEGAGAAAISVLTDGPDFGGSLEDLVAVRAAVEIPVLRKDFVVAAVQVAEARVAGADWVLLIAAVLDGGSLEEALEAARRCGAGALVEVHTDEDLDRALGSGARCVGVNNRDLTTLATDLGTFARLRNRVPSGVVTVAESGVRGVADVTRLVDEGADAVLVGEALMRHATPAALLAEMVAAAEAAWAATRTAR
ncbi:MAG: indole-3-glycerol-phosphate synthase [Candidatus Dormibacteraeota bacterium]|uniref:indole-3-glycerol-phosphate synthase n=1 Tax=Candidatus Amunia macphersoniae TaxID=3127014 RepID=A0A934KEX7_9BACT|nr:indole-3-glycerol-phosphate synthase [Candidatus Dormibacteraeota bacterium]